MASRWNFPDGLVECHICILHSSPSILSFLTQPSPNHQESGMISKHFLDQTKLAPEQKASANSLVSTGLEIAYIILR